MEEDKYDIVKLRNGNFVVVDATTGDRVVRVEYDYPIPATKVAEMMSDMSEWEEKDG